MDGVVARLISSDDVMVSYVEFDDGVLVPEHHHANQQAGVVISGTIRFHIDGVPHDLGAGDMFLIPPNALHSAQALGGPAVAIDIFTPPRQDYLNRENRAFGG